MSGLVLLALNPIAAHADNYGCGTYSSDVYNSSSDSCSGASSSSSPSSTVSSNSSSPTQESSVVKTESGLEVAINLADGQVIPSTGYYITVTPLNGQGRTFDKVEIYLNGVLAYTGTPDSTGTLKWFWDTAKNPATKVKVVVYGPGSGVTTHEFAVTVSPVQSTNQSATVTTTPTTSSAWPLWLMILLGILLALLVIVWWLIRRRRSRQQTPPPFTPISPIQ